MSRPHFECSEGTMPWWHRAMINCRYCGSIGSPRFTKCPDCHVYHEVLAAMPPEVQGQACGAGHDKLCFQVDLDDSGLRITHGGDSIIVPCFAWDGMCPKAHPVSGFTAGFTIAWEGTLIRVKPAINSRVCPFLKEYRLWLYALRIKLKVENDGC